MANQSNTPGQNEYSDLLYAYSLGCLDKEDLLELDEYFQTANEFPWQELGEYQNLAALLPAILNMETPGHELKDKVARKLYRIKNERRPQKSSGNIVREQTESETKQNIPGGEKAVLPDFFEHSKSLNENETPEDDNVLENDQLKQDLHADPSLNEEDAKAESFSQETADETSSDDVNSLKADEIDINEVSATQEAIGEKKPYQLHGIIKQKTEKKGKGGIILAIVLLIIAFLGLIYFYQIFSSNVERYKAGIDSLNKQVSELTQQVEVNKEVQKILQMKDVHIINLYGSSINKEGFGKIILSFESSSGFLQFSNLPASNTEKSFELWMATEGKAKSLGNFKPENNVYFPISLPVQNYKGEIRFFVTGDSSKDSTNPSDKVFLTGTLQ